MRLHFWMCTLLPGALGLAGACGSGNGNGNGNGGGTVDLCTPGGEACVTFSECCSGTCANQICTSCADDDAACGAGCCTGSMCANGVCGPPCKLSTEACSAARDCCSNVCSSGKCVGAAAPPDHSSP